jgi:hypothetical protein
VSTCHVTFEIMKDASVFFPRWVLCGLAHTLECFGRISGGNSKMFINNGLCSIRGPFSFVSTIKELLEIKKSGCGLESREYGRSDLLR